MLRLGLCCIFKEAPIRFRTTTAKALKTLEKSEQMSRLSALCLANANSLVSALEEIKRLGIGSFRVSSPLFPLYTHPEVGYRAMDLPDYDEITGILAQVKTLKNKYQLRLSFHPDQFTLLSSPRPEVTVAAMRDLHYQALLASLIGADVINIHGGGVYGDKPRALERLEVQISGLPHEIRSRLTLENDDQSYTVKDLEPLCAKLSVPLVYDVHHHRCNPDGLSIAEATDICLQSWQRVGREPYFHISSPKYGWEGKLRPHADYISWEDFPSEWLSLNATLDVEAKAKELAVLKIQKDMNFPLWKPAP